VFKISARSFYILCFFLIFLSPLWAAEKEPPVNVVVSKVIKGTIAPEQEFIGTVYYPEVSDVSAEVSGSVARISFDEGQKIKRNEVLVKLDSDLLEKTYQAKSALYGQSLSDLERAKKDLKRTVNLYRKKIIAEKEYDNQKFQVRGLEKKSASLKAEVERLEIELEKTEVKSPFNGVVIKKHVARGEWLSPGKPVATIARNDSVDIIVEVPEKVIKFLKPGTNVKVLSGGNELTGKLHTIIPQGDVSTRTFPVKIRVNQTASLLEGMEARVILPRGERITTFLVPRDAILNRSGKTNVVAVIDSKAKIIPTKVIGYMETKAGINSQNISEGMKVVVKGNERLRDGQPVNILKEVE